TGRHDLCDGVCALVAPLLPNKSRGVARVDDGRVRDGHFYLRRTGTPWRDLPERDGPQATTHNRYTRWPREHGLAEIMKGLQPARGLFELTKAMMRDAWDMRLENARRTKDALVKQLSDAERQIESLLDGIVDASSPSVV